jgi:hypothetical protein
MNMHRVTQHRLASRLGACLVGLTLLMPSTVAQSGVALGEVAAGQLKEISGLAASRRHPGVLYVHNDGSDGRLFGIGTNGQTVAVFELAAKVTDLEDIAIGPGPEPGVPHLYVGDIGDNDRRRSTVAVYRLPEPDLPSGTTAKRPAPLTTFDTLRLRYPDGAHDAEAVLCDPRTGDLLIATKEKRRSRIYLAPANRLAAGAEVALTLLWEVPVADVSAGDISPDGHHLILRRENAAFLWTRGAEEPLLKALARPSRRVAVIGPPTEPNGEALAWRPDGTGYYTLSEGKRQPVYFFALP